MYDKKNIAVNWKDLGIKILLVAAFLFLLFWIIPRPNLNPFYDRIFNDNLQTMKVAAKAYYTVDRLPENIDDSKRMSLQEMLDKHMLLPFLDRNDEPCDTNVSFVEVTKRKEDRFELKVQLTCGKETKHIITTIGCYDVCIDDDCVVFEYEFKRQITRTVPSYSCPKGYTRVGDRCFKSDKDYVPAIPVFSEGTTQITDAKREPGRQYTSERITNTTHSCPNGGRLSGNMCVFDSSTYPAIETLTCPNGGRLSGRQCIFDSNTYPAIETLTCPNGGRLSGRQCVFDSTTYPATPVPSCPNGGRLSGSICITNEARSYTATCNPGDTLQNGNCVKTNTVDVAAVAGAPFGNWVPVQTFRETTERRTYTNTTERLRESRPPSLEPACADQSRPQCVTLVTFYHYVLERRSATWSCPSGVNGTVSNGRCIHSTTVTYSPSCPQGGTRSGNTCNIAQQSYNATVTHRCNGNDTRNGNTCTTRAGTNYNATVNLRCNGNDTRNGNVCTTRTGTNYNATVTLRCNGNDSRSGNTCFRPTANDYQATPHTTRSCPSGWNSSGTGNNLICFRNVTNGALFCQDANAQLVGDKCHTTIPGHKTGYRCEDPKYTLDENRCFIVVKGAQSKPATKTTREETVWTYSWSTSTQLEGWTATGRKRELAR